MRLFGIASGACSGVENMAFDEALLETVRLIKLPTLVVRTYCWSEPTLSLGAHQPERDVARLLRLYRVQDRLPALVRRPTGGRAILHGEDLSFSFVTNHPALLRLSLNDSYAQLAGLVVSAIRALGISVLESAESSGKAYMRSPVCFETQTPSDILSPDGSKLAGCAQQRKQGGLLQHGAAFVAPYLQPGQGLENLTPALFSAVTDFYQVSFDPCVETELLTPAFQKILERLRDRYESESAGILARASTTVGSHLMPASC